MLQAIGPIATFGGEDARMPRVTWREGGTLHTERTPEPWAFARSLAERLGGEPEELEIRRPTLEDIYLGMVDPEGAAVPGETVAAPSSSIPETLS